MTDRARTTMPAPQSDCAKAAALSPALAAGVRTVAIERQALAKLEEAMATTAFADDFQQTVELIVQATGRVIVSGMGKSGLIGRKVAATLASTGTPAFFIHPAEASHGDLGMITRDDIVVALSWSGETAELSDVVSYCQRFTVPLVAITSRPTSTLAERADVVLALPSVEEACPNRLAPTSSTILQSSIGDALAVALVEARGFSADNFRVFHPKGQLGAQLLSIGEIMGSGDQVPSIGADATILAAMVEMSSKRYGITGVVDEEGRLVGAFSDGDLRRSLTMAPVDAAVRDYMTVLPLTIEADHLASEALAVMNAHNIMQLFVCRGAELVGIVHIHDILHAGVV